MNPRNTITNCDAVKMEEILVLGTAALGSGGPGGLSWPGAGGASGLRTLMIIFCPFTQWPDVPLMK